VVGTVVDANYTGSATNTLVIGPAGALVNLSGLSQVYDGTAKAVSYSTTPTNLSVVVTYNGSVTQPTNAGSYAVIGTISDVNYQGSATNTLVISKTAGAVTLDNLNQVYDGTAKTVASSTTPTNLSVVVTYNNSVMPPTNAGSYTVVGTISDINYQGSVTNVLLISKAAGSVALGNLNQGYDGAAKAVSYSTTPTNLSVVVTYNSNVTLPTNAGSYAVVGTISDINYQGTATNVLVINPAAATVLVSNLSQVYNGTARPVAVTTVPAGLSTVVSYNGAASVPTNAGSYAVVVTVSNPNYVGSATNTLVVSPASAAVTLGSLNQTYTGNPLGASAVTTPVGLTVNLTYNGSGTVPVNAGSYTVVGTVVDANYTGSATNTLVIAKAAATLTLNNLSQAYNGNAITVAASTTPLGLNVNFTYNGSASAPTNVGTYTVIGTISEVNYQGNATNVLIVGKAAATVSMGNLTQYYTGNACPVTAGTSPSGLAVNLTYNGNTYAPTNVGNYTVIGTVSDINYQGSATNTLVIGKGLASITMSNLVQTYNGLAHPVIVATVPSGLFVANSYGGSPNAPTNAGSYTVISSVVASTNWQGSVTNTLVVNKAAATVSLSNLTQYYTGSACSVTAATTPGNLTVNLTYNGNNFAPTNLGSYTVIGTISDINYQGTATNTLVVRPVLPSVVIQPLAFQTVTVGSNVNFTVSAGGTGPFGYRWQKAGIPLSDGGSISGSGSSNLVINPVAGTDAGTYSVVITNVGGSVVSSNALLQVNAQVYIVSTNTISGSTLTVPVRLQALGTEFSLSFSLVYDSTLVTFAGVDDPSVFVTTNTPLPGTVGLTFQNFAGYLAGDQLLVNAVFLAQPVTSNRVSNVSFGQIPVGEEVIDSSFNNITNVTYSAGSVSVTPAEYAADVYPRPTGDSTVDLRDWGQIGRFVVGLDTPTNADELLRADCAPRGNPDGVLTVADWVQAGRYAAHLDPLTVVTPAAGSKVRSLAKVTPKIGSSTLVQFVNVNGTSGQNVTMPVTLVASGTENALGFNVTFNPNQLVYRGIVKGSNAGSAVLNANTNQALAGRIGVALSLSANSHFSTGTNQVALLTFGVLDKGNIPVSFAANIPVVQQVCDMGANVLGAGFSPAVIIVPVTPGSGTGGGQPMNAVPTKGGLTLVWSAGYSNYSVQSTIDLGPGLWNSNFGPAYLVGTNYQMSVPMTNKQQFFRLSP